MAEDGSAAVGGGVREIEQAVGRRAGGDGRGNSCGRCCWVRTGRRMMR